MRHIVIVFFTLVFFVSCKEKTPSGIVSTDKMENILWDIMLADEMIRHQYAYDSSIDKKKKATDLYNHIFNSHKISYNDFQKNFKYYQARPDLLKIIFDSLSVKTPETRPMQKPQLIKPL